MLPASVPAHLYDTANDGTITITRWDCSNGGEVIIPNSIDGHVVTGLGRYAFYGCTSITSVTLPNSVTSIGDDAFFACWKLEAINVDVNSSTYTSLNGVLFNKSRTTLIRCPGGKTGSYTIPSGITSIDSYALQGCVNLVNVAIPVGVMSIGRAAFAFCTNMVSIEIPMSTSSIGDYAFGQCANLTHVAIPNGVALIGEGAFSQCASLVSVMIPGSVTNIGTGMLAGCPSLADVMLASGLTSIPNYTFAGCSALATIEIPTSVLSIGDGAFLGCADLTNAAIPKSVTSIGNSCFEGCISLPSVSIPIGATRIGDRVFEGCTTMGSVTIPYTVTLIGSNAFDSCASLTAIIVDANNPSYSSVDGVLFNKSQTTLIQCPGGREVSYSIPTGVTSIGDFSFTGCIRLESVTIPSDVTSIGNYAFMRCNQLRSVYFEGNAPAFFGQSVFFNTSVGVTFYYLPGTVGWGYDFHGIQAVRWDVKFLTANDSFSVFGVKDGQFGFTVFGPRNLTVVVETCTDLAHPLWSPVGTNRLDNATFYFSDAHWTNFPNRFYRLRSP